MRRAALLLLVVLAALAISPAFAEIYYADVELDVRADGSTVVSGTTNHPLLATGTTQAFTSKSRDRWLLNVTIPDTLSDYVFTVKLPPGAMVNYVNSRHLTLGSEGDRVVIKLVGTDGPVSIVAQYQVGTATRDWLVEALAAAATVAGFALVFWLAHRHGERRARRAEGSKGVAPTKSGITLYDGLSRRQQDIIDLLRASGGRLTQKQVEKALELPKASVSRNVESLRRKGILEKQGAGMSNVLELTERR